MRSPPTTLPNEVDVGVLWAQQVRTELEPFTHTLEQFWSQRMQSSTECSVHAMKQRLLLTPLERVQEMLEKRQKVALDTQHREVPHTHSQSQPTDKQPHSQPQPTDKQSQPQPTDTQSPRRSEPDTQHEEQQSNGAQSPRRPDTQAQSSIAGASDGLSQPSAQMQHSIGQEPSDATAHAAMHVLAQAPAQAGARVQAEIEGNSSGAQGSRWGTSDSQMDVENEAPTHTLHKPLSMV